MDKSAHASPVYVYAVKFCLKFTGNLLLISVLTIWKCCQSKTKSSFPWSVHQWFSQCRHWKVMEIMVNLVVDMGVSLKVQESSFHIYILPFIGKELQRSSSGGKDWYWVKEAEPLQSPKVLCYNVLEVNCSSTCIKVIVETLMGKHHCIKPGLISSGQYPPDINK